MWVRASQGPTKASTSVQAGTTAPFLVAISQLTSWHLEMHEVKVISNMQADSPPCRPAISLLDLPSELRLRIFQYALDNDGTVELQCPVWASKPVQSQPLFKVCRLLRDEALQAFYEVNSFLWVIDTTATHRSDPSTYKSLNSDAVDLKPDGKDILPSGPLTPSLPWQYPGLGRHLRHLQLNVYLPSNLYADLEASQAWQRFPELLENVVRALDFGRKLWDVHVLITAKRINTRIALAGEQLSAIDVLAKMEVRGNVRLQYRYDFKEIKSGLVALNLERRMKAH